MADVKEAVKAVEEKVKDTAKKVAEKKAADKKPADKKPAEKKVKKAVAKTAVAKKVVAKATAKKAAAKAKDPKTTVILQYAGKEVDYTDIVKNATKLAKKAAKKDVKDIKVYVKPEENMAYYVANGGDEIGSFGI